MPERGGSLGFTEETFPGTWIARDRRQHGFQSHQTFQVRVFRTKNDTHPASTEYLQHPVRPKSPDFVWLFRWCQEIARLRAWYLRTISLGFQSLAVSSEGC